MKIPFLKSLRGFTDRTLFLSKLREEFDSCSDFELVETLEEIVEHSYRGNTLSWKVLLLLGDPLVKKNLFGEREKYIKNILEDFEFHKSKWLFCEDAKPYSPFEEENSPFFPELEELSLGHKKYYAKQFNRKLLERLLYDSHPEVIRALLANPVLTERDVLKIASRRNINPSILCEIYRNEKWIKRHTIRVSLVNNPHTPVCIRIALIPGLLIQDLRELLKDHQLHPYVKEATLYAINCRSI